MALTENRRAQIAGWSLLLAALAVASYWSCRLAWADQLSRSADPVSVARAVRLAPGNEEFHLRVARALDKRGEDPTLALESAAALNPFDAGVWMRLGLRAEMRGDFDGAERDLLQAARISRQFEPRWTLANYYLRRNDPASF